MVCIVYVSMCTYKQYNIVNFNENGCENIDSHISLTLDILVSRSTVG